MTVTRQPVNDGNQHAADGASRIRVCVRIRPENTTEMNGNHRTVVNKISDNLLIFDPKTEASPDYYHGKQRRMRDIRKKTQKDMRFVFDHVFDEHSSNEELYEHTTKGILDGLLDGYNCSGMWCNNIFLAGFIVSPRESEVDTGKMGVNKMG